VQYLKKPSIDTNQYTPWTQHSANWYLTAQQGLVLERIFLFNAFLRRLKASWDYPVIIAVFFSTPSLTRGTILFDY
jgi:hypothetical protein